jgi:hypothetical protein
MKKTFVALSALVVGGGLATAADAQTSIDTSSLTFTNTIIGAVDAQSTNKINLVIGGKVAVKGTVTPNSIGQSLVDGKQLLNTNTVTLVTPAATGGSTAVVLDNDATLGANSFSNAVGNVGINVAAGDNLAQDNAVAITTVQSSEQGLKADIVKLQEAIGNLFNPNGAVNNIDMDNDASVASGSFNGLSGNLGANVAAGANIGQQNALAVSVAAAGKDNINLASANVGVVQKVSGNHSWVSTLANNASVGDVGQGSSGNIGLNVAAGANILQNNALAVTAVSN